MHWLYQLWYGYVWPSLKGNGPEAVVQTVAYAAIGVLLVPVVRRAVRAEMKRAHAELMGLEAEGKKIEREFAWPLKAPFRTLVRFFGTLLRVRVTVKDVKAIDAVGTAVEAVDPALAPAVTAVEDAARTAASDTMRAQ